MIIKVKFFKKIAPILMVLAIIVFSWGELKVFAYTGGLLDKKPLIIGNSSYVANISNITSATDRNISTEVILNRPGYGNDYLWYDFSSPVTLTDYSILSPASNYNPMVKITATKTDNTVVLIADVARSSATGNKKNIITPITDVKRITINNLSSSDGFHISEFDVWGSSPPTHDDLTFIIISQSYNSVSLSWSNLSSNTNLTEYKVYRDSLLISSPDKYSHSYVDNSVFPNKTYNYKVTAIYSDSFETMGMSKSVTTLTEPHDEISNFNASMTHHSADLGWSIPDNPYLVGFKIYRNGELIKTLDTTENYYLDDGLDELTSYKYKVTSLYDDGFETQGIEKTFTTNEDPEVKKVANADAKAVSYKQINISWDLPNQTGFHHVNIYRAVKPQEQGFFEWLLGSIVSADTTPTEIFETNGTYFNDLTVKPDTNYEYMLTTETTDGRVSDEVTVAAETPSEPTPELKTDGNYTVNQDGSYVFKWTAPTTGKVKVLIDGKDYKIVDASLKQITIPKADMKTNIWGDPSVSMIPVGEFGTEGKEVFTGGNSFLKSLKLPFQSSDLLTTSMGILGLVAPIILLVLVIYYFKPIKRLIVNTILKIKERRGVKT